MGYDDSAAPDQLDGYMAPGSVGLYPDGDGLLRAFGAPSDTGILGALYATVIANDHGGMQGKGTVIAYRSSPAAGSDSILFVGPYNVIRNGAVVALGTNRMQMKVGAGSPFELGLNPPSTPTVVAEASGGTKVDGSYAFAAAVKRSVTNGVSNASPRTAPIPVSAGGRFKVTIPPQNTLDPQVDIYQVYATVANFSTIGVLFLAKEYKYGTDVPVGGGDVYLDFYDAELLGIAGGYLYLKPPDCTHLFTLGGYVMAAGCYPTGGWGVAPSLLNKPDAYDPDTVAFLNPGAPITACTGRAGDGFQYIACRDSLHGCILTGDPTAPVLCRVLWGNDGFVSGNQLCYVETELWGMSSARGPVRTSQGSEPDRSFARRVQHTLEAMGPTAVVGFDPASNQIVYAGGSTAIAYMRGMGGDTWSAPMPLPGVVQSRVTVGGQLYLVIDNTLHRWNGGAVASWVFRPFRKSRLGHVQCVTEVQIDALTDVNLSIISGHGSTVVYGPQAVTVTEGHSGYVQLNEPDLRSYAPQLSGTGAAALYRVTANVLASMHRG
jgi:hypothetical protein